MNPKHYSGIEILRAIMHGEIPPPSMTEVIPMKMEEVREGYVRFSAKADHRHLNPMGGVHGGFAASVLDTVLGCAVHTMLEPRAGYGTVDLNIKLLKPIIPNTELTAEARVLQVSKRIGFSEGDIRDSDGVAGPRHHHLCHFQRVVLPG